MTTTWTDRVCPLRAFAGLLGLLNVLALLTAMSFGPLRHLQGEFEDQGKEDRDDEAEEEPILLPRRRDEEEEVEEEEEWDEEEEDDEEEEEE